MLSLYGFLPVILLPIRLTGNSATLIDHIYYYPGTFTSPKISSGNFLMEITAHLPNFLVLLEMDLSQILRVVHKCLLKMHIPVIFHDYFKHNSDVHSYGTTNSNNHCNRGLNVPQAANCVQGLGLVWRCLLGLNVPIIVIILRTSMSD